MSTITNTVDVMEQMNPEDQSRVLAFAKHLQEQQMAVPEEIDEDTKRELDRILANYDSTKSIPGEVVHARMYARIEQARLAIDANRKAPKGAFSILV